jgi:hypothetical protein
MNLERRGLIGVMAKGRLVFENMWAAKRAERLASIWARHVTATVIPVETGRPLALPIRSYASPHARVMRVMNKL